MNEVPGPLIFVSMEFFILGNNESNQIPKKENETPWL